MAYPLIRHPDQLPAAGVAQKLLNGRAGSSLVADGIFGQRSTSATRDFQRPRGLAVDGVIGRQTWPRLAQQADALDIIDCVDVFDPSLYELEAGDIRREGGNPILIGGMSNGVEQAMNEIVRAARSGKVFLLRFHGHGAPGHAGISSGQGGFVGEHLDSVHLGNWLTIEPVVRRLRSIFGPYGCIQFMHCETGRSRRGMELLQKFSLAAGVPVSAGVNTQFGGGSTTFRFEGPTRTAFPNGETLRSWCTALPDFVGMTVP